MPELRRFDLAGAVVPGAQLIDARAVDIETDDRHPGAGKRHGDRQADVAEPDDGDFTIVPHVGVNLACPAIARPCLAAGRHKGQ